jgi:hypothetical protein
MAAASARIFVPDASSMRLAMRPYCDAGQMRPRKRWDCMYIGIDPGQSGALEVLADDGTLVSAHATPTITRRTRRGTGQEYDVPGLVALLALSRGPQSHASIEEAQAMPGQGMRSMFTIGVGLGLCLGVLAALQMPHTRGRPHAWKRALGLGKDKEASRLRAMPLFPGADLWRKQDHGRAEALRRRDMDMTIVEPGCYHPPTLVAVWEGAA